jgi:RHS repeat-associated protein
MTFDGDNNQIIGKTYDSAGNLTVDGAVNYAYDAENHLAKINRATGYKYDGEGRRVRKLIGENIRFIYGIGGGLIVEFDGSTGTLTKEYVSGGGMMAVIEPTVGTRYTTADHLGSPRVVTSDAGSPVSRHDYKPFGVELGDGTTGRTTLQGYGASDGLRKQFTGYERDNETGETGLDYAQARYYSSVQGRFTSSDPFAGKEH